MVSLVSLDPLEFAFTAILGAGRLMLAFSVYQATTMLTDFHVGNSAPLFHARQ